MVAAPARPMTAVTMIFEMTLGLSLPMILAVAAGLGVRRALSRENIYTAKLIGRGHVIPKALHANVFLVRAAKDVMAKDFVPVPAETQLDAFLRLPEHRTATSSSPVASTSLGWCG